MPSLFQSFKNIFINIANALRIFRLQRAWNKARIIKDDRPIPPESFEFHGSYAADCDRENLADNPEDDHPGHS